MQRVLAGLLLGVCSLRAAWPGDLDEFKIKREEVFEFVQPPRVTRSGDRVEITFESKGFCDTTVALENAAPSTGSAGTPQASSGPAGKIVRHLACGVLGPHAPEPFQKNTLKQTLVWDGKDDQGRYVDDKSVLSVRVSLGLQPRFEKTLFWSPYKRISGDAPLLHAAAEGLYVFEGSAADHLRLFSHSGEYQRTVYPFPADKLDQAQGLQREACLQDGRTLPVKQGQHAATLLTSANRGGMKGPFAHGYIESRSAATALAVRDTRMALVKDRLNRLATDGTTGGLPLEGPGSLPAGVEFKFGAPASAAFSPDGKRVYLAGYQAKVQAGWGYQWHALHGVAVLDYELNAPPRLFAGALNEKDAGAQDDRFDFPTSVACDSLGRVYVTDFGNQRVQVLSPEGKLLKSIPAVRPALLRIHPKTQELYVFSWVVPLITHRAPSQGNDTDIAPTLTRFGPFDNPRKLGEYALPYPKGKLTSWYWGGGRPVAGEIDFWSDPLRVWVCTEKAQQGSWMEAGMQVLVEKDGKLVFERHFGKVALETLVDDIPVVFRQRLYVNPVSGMLYLENKAGMKDHRTDAESAWVSWNGFGNLTEIDPENGKTRNVPMPFSVEELAFDQNEMAYLRTQAEVVRYDAKTWKEVPWDYGEEREKVGGGPNVLSALPAPGINWTLSGLGVAATGHLVVSWHGYGPGKSKAEEKDLYAKAGYAPKVYPGRSSFYKLPVIQVFDKHGKRVHEDAVPGLGLVQGGLQIDRNDAVYLMAGATRILDGKNYPSKLTGTLMKFRPGQGKIIATSGAPVPVPEDLKPKGPPQIAGPQEGRAWVEGAEWLYGGVGLCPKNISECACSNASFTLDYFARSFAPELDHCSVAVLDSNGNLILRVGRYGNVEDGQPRAAAGGPRAPRALGGDEVGLFYAPYLATHTDRRLFIADVGNARIVSVKLGYHAEAMVGLKDVPDRAK